MLTRNKEIISKAVTYRSQGGIFTIPLGKYRDGEDLGQRPVELGEWVQQIQHIPGKTSEISVQKSAVLETSKIL